MLGNPRYLSVYMLGVAQAMHFTGNWHRTVSLFDPYEDVVKQVAEMQPDVIWTHMALWPPPNALTVDQITNILGYWKRRGVCVYLHDGDPRQRDTGVDINSFFSVALVNRNIDTDHYRITSLKWPYAAMAQHQIGTPRTEWQRDLVFAGIVRRDKELYGKRTELVLTLQEKLGPRMIITSPGGGDVNNRMLVADVAPSAGAVLGFGRPEVPGWIDTRVFQYPGAGGVLVHDDASEYLEPDRHYLKFKRSESLEETVESVLKCLEKAKEHGSDIRVRAFEHVQTHHTWVQRVQVALEAFYGRR